MSPQAGDRFPEQLSAADVQEAGPNCDRGCNAVMGCQARARCFRAGVVEWRADMDVQGLPLEPRPQRLSAGCHHDGCTDKDWFSLKALFEVADETDHADDGGATQGTLAMPSGGAFRRCPKCGERPAPPDALCFRCQPEGEE
jgi:hypothetical protein